MKKLIAFLIFVLAFAPVIAGAIPPSPPIVVQEVDGTPYGAVSKFVFTNGTVTLSAGVATIDITGGAGQPITLIAGGETKSENLGGITVTNDTNSIFTESSADVLGIDVSKRWPTADVANAGDSATAFFSEGTMEAARLPVASGTTAGIAPTTSGVTDGWVLTVQADESVAWEASSAGVTTIAAATDTAIADPAEANILIWDGSDSWDNKAVSGDVTIAATGEVTIGAEKILESHLAATDSATDEDVLTFEGTGFEWHSRNEIASGATIVTYANGALVDMSGITHDGTNNEGLTLPFWADVTPAASATKRFIAWDEAGANLKVMTATGWANFSTGTAPTDAGYLLIGSSPLALTADRILTEGTGIDLTDAGANSTLTVNVDTTEIGDTTWGSGSAITWTFNASGGTDPTIAAGDGGFAITGTLSVTGALAANGGITMGTGDGFTVNSVNLLSGDELDGTKIKDADYGDVTINADGAWAVEDDSHAHGSTTITLASTNLSDTANVARLDADNTFTGTTNTVGNANTDILAVQSTLRGVGRAVSIDDDTTTAPTYATGTNELFVEGDIETDGTVYAASLNTGTGTDGSRAITMTNNDTLEPTASGNKLYFYGNVFKVVEDGTAKAVITSDKSATWTGTTHSFAGVTNVVLPTAAPDAAGEIGINTTNNQLIWHDGAAVVKLDTTTLADGKILKYSAANAQFQLEDDATGSSPTLNSVGNPTADTTIAMDAGEEVNFDYTGNFTTGSQFKIEQKTGDPTGGVLFEAKAADEHVTVARFGDGTNYLQVSYTGNLSHAGTSSLVSPRVTTAIAPLASDGAALGTTALMWSDLFIASGGVLNFNNGDVTLTHGSNVLTLGGGDLALGANNLTMTGSLAATGARVTKGWFTDVEITNLPTVGGNTISPTNVTPVDTADENAAFYPLLVDGATGTQATETDGELSYNPSTDLLTVANITMSGDLSVGDDLSLLSDAAVLNFGADSDVTLTHVADTALLLNSSRQLQFGDSGTYINQPADTFLNVQADVGVRITASDEDLQIVDAGTNNIGITSSTGVTDITFYGAAAANAMNLATTGTILGAIKVQTAGSTEGAGAHAYSPAAALMYGILITIDDSDSVTTVNLPDYQAAADADHVKVGASVCVMNLQAKATIIAPSADDKIRTSNGTLNAGAATVTGPATIGAFSCFVLTDAATDVGHWTQMGMNGAWPVTP